MRVIEQWTGREADALRRALHMTADEFAVRVKASPRTVNYWHERPSSVPQPATQRALESELEAASDQAQARFSVFVGDERSMDSTNSENASPWGSLGEADFSNVTPDDKDRLALAVQKPARIDLAVVDSLATILAIQRRLDDTLGPGAILHATSAQSNSVTELLRDSRGPARDALAPVAAEWVQFDGWLHAELRQDATATHLLTQAEEMADDSRSGALGAQAANFKGYLARQQGRPHGIVRHFLTAYHTPGAHPAQRLGDAVQAAHGYALLGESADALRMLREAELLEPEAVRRLPPGTAYWLTPDFQRMNMGLALLALGEHAAAAEHIASGLDSLPADQQHAEWTREYRDALAEAQDHT